MGDDERQQWKIWIFFRCFYRVYEFEYSFSSEKERKQHLSHEMWIERDRKDWERLFCAFVNKFSFFFVHHRRRRSLAQQYDLFTFTNPRLLTRRFGWGWQKKKARNFVVHATKGAHTMGGRVESLDRVCNERRRKKGWKNHWPVRKVFSHIFWPLTLVYLAAVSRFNSDEGDEMAEVWMSAWVMGWNLILSFSFFLWCSWTFNLQCLILIVTFSLENWHFFGKTWKAASYDDDVGFAFEWNLVICICSTEICSE